MDVTDIQVLLRLTNWLSVYQLCMYHSLLLMWKIKTRNEPTRLIERIETSEITSSRIEYTEKVWSRRVNILYGKLPVEIRSEMRISKVKKSLKTWIGANIPIRE